MFGLISVIILLICLLLILVVLVQDSKGGGLSASFGGSNQVMGVRRTTDFLEKASWTLAIALLVLCIVASWAIKKPEESKSRIEQQIESPADFDQSLPSIPTGLPDEETE